MSSASTGSEFVRVQVGGELEAAFATLGSCPPMSAVMTTRMARRIDRSRMIKTLPRPSAKVAACCSKRASEQAPTIRGRAARAYAFPWLNRPERRSCACVNTPATESRPHLPREGLRSHDRRLALERSDLVRPDPKLGQDLARVFPQDRPGAFVPDGRARHADGRARRADAAELAVRELTNEAARAHMLVLEHLVERVEDPARDTRAFEEPVPVLARPAAGDLLDERGQLPVVLPPERPGRKALVRRQVLYAERRGERLPVGGRRRADRDVAVRRPDRLVWRVDPVGGPERLRYLPRREIAARLPRLERDRRLEEAHVDLLARAVAVAHPQSRKNRVGGEERGREVRERDPHLHRRAALPARDRQEPPPSPGAEGGRP